SPRIARVRNQSLNEPLLNTAGAISDFHFRLPPGLDMRASESVVIFFVQLLDSGYGAFACGTFFDSQIGCTVRQMATPKGVAHWRTTAFATVRHCSPPDPANWQAETSPTVDQGQR